MKRRYIDFEIDNTLDVKKKYPNQWETFKPFADRYENLCLQFDGIIDIDTWEKTNLKILFLLKDSYRPVNKNGDYNTARFSTYVLDCIANKTKDKIKDKTWKQVLLWANAISKKCGFGEIENLKNVAFMNVNKLAFKSENNTNSENSNLKIAVKEDKDILREQLEIISPDIIVCGNTGKYLFDILKEKGSYISGIGKQKDGRNPLYLYKTDKYVVFDAYHPSYRETTTVKEFEKLITENEELFKFYENRKNQN